MKWKRLASKKLFDHPRITLYEDDVQLPCGLRTKYLHFSTREDAAMVLAVDTEGKFLIQEEYSYPPDEVLYQLPGGAVNKGESPEDGARRELAEEANLAAEKLEPLGWFYVHNRRSSQKMYVYLASNLSKTEAEKDPEELFEYFWFTEEDIDHMIATNEVRNYTLLAGRAQYKAYKKTRVI